MKINYKKFIIILLATFIIGGIFSFLTFGESPYDKLQKPSFAPPPIVFPIAWSILYFLMAVSLYMVSESNSGNKTEGYILYFVQLIVNSLWTLLSFGLNLRFVSFLWIILLLVLVLLMIVSFYRTNKLAGILQVPYAIWLIFAMYLSYNIYLLNKV